MLQIVPGVTRKYITDKVLLNKEQLDEGAS